MKTLIVLWCCVMLAGCCCSSRDNDDSWRDEPSQRTYGATDEKDDPTEDPDYMICKDGAVSRESDIQKSIYQWCAKDKVLHGPAGEFGVIDEREAINAKFEEDNLHGQFRARYSDGEVQYLVTYDKGKLHGHAIFYDEQGVTIAEGGYNKGKRHGVWQVLNEKSEILETLHYNQGKVTN